MKLTAVFIVLGLVLCSSLAAITTEEFADLQTGRLTEALALDSLQAGQVRAVILQELPKLALPGQNQGGGRRGPGAGMQPASDEATEALKELITSEQATILDSLNLPLLPEPRSWDLNSRLGLTMDQYLAVESIMAEQRDKITALRSSGHGDRRQMREQMRSLSDEEDSRIDQLLTDSQKSIFARMKEEREQRMHDMRPPGQGPGRQ